MNLLALLYAINLEDYGIPAGCTAGSAKLTKDALQRSIDQALVEKALPANTCALQ